jgi:hypothetical protein
MRATLEWHEPPDGTEAIKSERAAARCVCEKSRRDGEASVSLSKTNLRGSRLAITAHSVSRANHTITAPQAALWHAQLFHTVRARRTVTPLCLLADNPPLPYVHRAGHCVPHVLRAGCDSPPAVKAATPSPRAPGESRGQQIRCNSGADGIVRMKENGTSAGLPASATHWGRAQVRGDFP